MKTMMMQKKNSSFWTWAFARVFMLVLLAGGTLPATADNNTYTTRIQTDVPYRLEHIASGTGVFLSTNAGTDASTVSIQSDTGDNETFYFEEVDGYPGYYCLKDALGNYLCLLMEGNNNWSLKLSTTAPPAPGIDVRCFLFRIADCGESGMVLQNYYNATEKSKTDLKDYLGTNQNQKGSTTPVYSDKPITQGFSYWRLMTTTPKYKLQVEIATANYLLETTPVGSAHYQVSQEAKTAYQTAIATAQSAYDSAKTDKDSYDALSNLETATNAFKAAFGPFTLDESRIYTLGNRSGSLLTFTSDNSVATVTAPAGTDTPSTEQYLHFESVSGSENTYKLYYQDSEEIKHYLSASNNDGKWVASTTSATSFTFAKVDGSCCFFTLTGSNRVLGSSFGVKSNVTTRTTTDSNNDYSLSHWLLTPAGVLYKFHVINKSGTESVYKSCTIRDESATISLPNVLRSPGASAYHYSSTMEKAVAGDYDYDGHTYQDLSDRDIYVSYEVDESKFKMNDDNIAFVVNVAGVYLKNDSEGNLTYDATEVTDPANFTDAHKWKLTATYSDPYNCSFVLYNNTEKKLTVNSSDLGATSNSVALSTTGDIDKWIILMGKDGKYRLLPVYPTQRRFTIYNNNGTLKLESCTYITTIEDDPIQARVDPIIGVTYTIVKNDGSEFCTVASNAPGKPDLAEYLKSPLATNYRYYTTLEDAQKDAAGNEVTPYTDWAVNGGHYYVRYSYKADNGALSDGRSISLSGDETYLLSGFSGTNVSGFNYMCALYGNGNWEALPKQNNCRVAWIANGGSEDSDNSAWVFYGEDPYAITIRNKAMMEDDNYKDVQYFMGPVVNDDNQGHIYMYNDNDREKTTPTWALLTGNSLISTRYGDKTRYRYFDNKESISTSLRYFSAGSLPAAAPITIVFKSVLNTYNYHIIDKQGYEAISGVGTTNTLEVPFTLRSPLVETYHFYDASAFTTETVDGQTKYTLTGSPTELTAPQTDIYVTYEVSNAYKLTNNTYANGKPYGGTEYVLQYTNAPTEIDQEKADYPDFGKHKPAYPYVNGNGGFYLFCGHKYDDTISDGFSTGTRYQMNFVSATAEPDPYDVKIVFPKNFDKASQHYNKAEPNMKYYSWFCTYDDSEQGVVTTLTQEDRSTLKYTDSTPEETKAQYAPSRYMLIGATTKAVSLYTREKFNGSNLLVDKYQHMWKSEYDHPAPAGSTVKEAVEAKGVTLHTLDIDKDWFRKTNPRLWVGSIDDPYTVKDDDLTRVIPAKDGSDSTATIKPLVKKAREELVNDSLYHWFQTVEMGAVFEIDKTDAPPVLYLLDNHHWIIHQQRLSTSAREPLRRLNSPLVKKYRWYKLNADKLSKAKISDYYKYNFDEDTTNVDSWYVGSTTDLADWKYVEFNEEDAPNTVYFVTYEVADIYQAGYDPETDKIIPTVLFEEHTSLATPSTTDNKIVFATSSDTYYDQEESAVVMANMLKANPTEDLLWQIRRNTNIDEECGFTYGEGENSQASIEAVYDERGKNYFDPYNIQVVSQKRVDDSNTASFVTLPYTGSGEKAVITENGYPTLTEGIDVIAQTPSQNPNIREQRTGTTFMYVEGNDGYGEMVSRFDPDYALRKKDGELIVYKKDANNDDARARFTPVTPYTLYIKQRGATTYDVGPLHVYAVTGHKIIFKKYHRSLCDYKFYSDESCEKRIYNNPVTGGSIYAIYDIQGVKFFDSTADLMASTDPTAWNFLQMGVGFQEKKNYYNADNLGIYFGLNDGAGTSHLSDADAAKLTAAEKSFLQRDGSRSLHLLGRKGNMQTPVCTGGSGTYTVTQSPTTGDDEVGALTGNHYMPSVGRVADVGLLSPHNDFRRIAETYKDNNDYLFREGRWLWGFVGTPYNFKMVNKETGETKLFGVKKTYTTDGDTKTYTGYESTPVLTEETTSDDYATDWEMGDGYTDDTETGTFTIRLNGGDQYIIMKSYNSPVLALQSAGTTTANFMQRSLKAYPWNYTANKYKTVTVNIYQDAMEGTPVLTKTYTPADRVFMAGDVIDGTTGHFYLRHTDESGNAITSTSVDEYGQSIPFDDNLRDLPYDLIRKFCDYTVAAGTNVTTLNGRNAFTVADTDEEQTLNVIFTLQTPENTGKRIPRFIKESDLATFKALKDNESYNGHLKEDYYYFMDMWDDMRSYMHIAKKKVDVSGTAYASDSVWAFNYITNRFKVENADQLKWYFVGNPYAVRIYNAYSEVKDMNLGTNKQDGNTFVFSTERKYDDVALMHSDDNAAYSKNGKFYWEMVDAIRRYQDGSYYDLNHNVISYRKDIIQDNAFSLRVLGDEHYTGEGSGTYHYLSINYSKKADYSFNKYESNSGGDLVTNTMSTKNLYALNDNTLDVRGNLLRNSMLTFPTLHHASDSTANIITAMPIARVYLTVYDHEDCTTKVTDNELSEHYAVTERFQGVPDNLKRRFCNYTWLSTDAKPEVLSDPTNSHNNMLSGSYATIDESEVHLYATYKETEDSPFSTLDEKGMPVLKRSNAFGASPWYNMKIGDRWAKFDSNLQGYREDVQGNVLNNSTVYYPFGDDLKQAAADPTKASKIFKMGLHWALIGDPYNFKLMNRRDRILLNAAGTAQELDANSNYQYEKAYLNETAINTAGNATVWTMMKNAKEETNLQYFLSESDTRRSRLSTTVAPSKVNRSLLEAYPITNAAATKNFYQNGGKSSITTGNSYAVGSNVILQAIDTEGIENDVFDAIVNVYNKMNELVATTGWTELPRNNANWSSELPVDVKRWGCNYHFWGDETMTKYPFSSYQQKIDADGNLIPLADKETTGEYLIQNGGTVYVNYDYDESIYSSENEYRWVNMFFNWDSTHKIWPKKSKDFDWYTTEDWEYNSAYDSDKTQAPYTLRASQKLYRTYDYYDTQNNPTVKYKETDEGWISSPAADAGDIVRTKAYAYERDQLTTTEQKWALIGDPYRFILYNFNRKKEASSDNAYYLYYDNGEIKNENFTGMTAEARATKQGIYWTWKMDGTNYSYTKLANESDPNKDSEELTCATTTYVREGLPSSFYQSTDKLQLQTGYLAVCDMEAKSLYQTTGRLVGAVKAYATFAPETETITVDNNASATSYTGFNDKYYAYYPQNGTTTHGNSTRGESDSPSYYYQGTSAADSYSLWKSTYGQDANGVWQGPGNAEPESSTTTYKRKQTLTANLSEQQLLTATGGPSTDANTLAIGDAKRFLVVPMVEKAATVTFHLDTRNHGDSKRNWASNPICDYTTNNFGVDNTLSLPWMMRRQYCDYKFYVLEISDTAPGNTSNRVDALVYNAEQSSSAHSMASRSGDYETFWNTEGTLLSSNVIPREWNDKHVYIRVTYEPTSDFMASTNTGDGDAAKASTVKWMNIVNQEKGNMLQYSRSKGTTGDNTNPGAFATNDYLWAIEGDPYGFVLHNRYADHGFDNTSANEHWTDKVLTTQSVNTDEKFNYDDTETNTNFADGKKSGLLLSKVEATAPGVMTTSGTETNSVYEAMTGNYDGAMLLHPVAAPVNVQDRNGYKFYSAFLFNATNKWPVQLNYMEDWDVMRNVFANWRIQPQTGEQLLPYYNRAGYVGGLKADVAANQAFTLNETTVNVPELFGKLSAGTATAAETEQARLIAENPANIVQLEENHYYRIRKFSDVAGGGEYLTGYIHKLELDSQDGTALHTWGKNDSKVASYITQLEGDEGNSWANGLYQNRLSILYPERDQSSVFRFTKNADGQWKMETQGLVVSDNVMIEAPAEPTTAQEAAMYYEIQDIGLGAMQMRTAANATSGSEASYMSYNPTTAKFGLNVDAGELNIANSIHDTKWLIEPVGATATNAAGNTYQRPLKTKLTTIDGNQYVTLYLPFNYTLSGSTGTAILPKTGNLTNVEAEKGDGKSKYKGEFNMVEMTGTISANTPVLVKATKEQAPDGYVYINLVNEAPTYPEADAAQLLYGVNLTQVLDESVLDGDADKKVFIYGASGGKPGFFVNASRDYENKANNLFIPHNSIYFVLTNKQVEDVNSGKSLTIEFEKEEDVPTGIDSAVKDQQEQGDGIIYDLSGRKVERVTQPGIYIRNGKKIVIK